MTQSNIKCIKMTEDVGWDYSRQQSNTFVKLEDTNTILDYKTQNGGIINWDIASQDILPDPSGRFKIKLSNFPIDPVNKICVKTKLKGAISTNINIIESRSVETFTNKLNINPDFANIFQLWGNDCLNAKDSTPSFEEIMQLIKDQTNKGDVSSDYYEGLKIAAGKVGELLSFSDIMKNSEYKDIKTGQFVKFTEDDWVKLISKNYSKITPETETRIVNITSKAGKIVDFVGKTVNAINLALFVTSVISDLENIDKNLNDGKFPLPNTAGYVAGFYTGVVFTSLINTACLLSFGIVTAGTGAVICLALSIYSGIVISQRVQNTTVWLLTDVLNRDNAISIINNISNEGLKILKLSPLGLFIESIGTRVECASNLGTPC